MTEEDKGIVDLVNEYQQGGPAPEMISMSSPETAKGNDIQSKLDALLEHVGGKDTWIPIKLPTLGKPYEGYGSDQVTIRAFTFEDERSLKQIGEASSPEEAMKTLLQSCIQGIAINALTIADKNYLLYKIREISYGSRYTIEGSCNSCNTLNKLNLELSALDVSYMEDYSERLTVHLPDSKKTATIRMPRVSDEPFINTVEKLMDNISRFVVDIEGIDDDKVIYAFLRKTTLKDVVTLRNSVFNLDCGYEKDVLFECVKCRTDNKTVLGLNENFFTVS